jgi:4-hydroxy-2-oxoheptanedioate aldolase
MKQNVVKRKLAAGEPVLGLFVPMDSPDLVEMCGYAGLDFVLLDAEHGPMDAHDLVNMVRAAECGGITPLARVTQPTPQTILRFLDVGVMGVMIPWCQSAAEAEAAVRAAKYHPQGQRGIAGTRPAHYGVDVKLADYVVQANAETMVIVQIETAATLRALPEMVRVPGVDVFFIGPNDLAQSLGHPGRQDEPDVQEAIAAAIAVIRGAGKQVGFYVRTADDARAYHERGVNFLAAGVPSVIAPALRGFAKALEPA